MAGEKRSDWRIEPRVGHSRDGRELGALRSLPYRLRQSGRLLWSTLVNEQFPVIRDRPGARRDFVATPFFSFSTVSARADIGQFAHFNSPRKYQQEYCIRRTGPAKEVTVTRFWQSIVLGIGVLATTGHSPARLAFIARRQFPLYGPASRRRD